MITYFRECTMPSSPDSKISALSANSPKVPTASGSPQSNRPLSSSSTTSCVKDNHSPVDSCNGRDPSPPSLTLMNASSDQQLPPACGARQLSKLKRFLTTLQQFGSDISPEIGQRVRTLVLSLVNSHLAIEEFHTKLQEATNFPLRPFVIPFLKASLPLLQRELLHCSRLAKQSPQQFLTQNEHILFDPLHSPLEMHGSALPEINENGKRCSPESRTKDNGIEYDHLSPAKRHHGSYPLSPLSNSRVHSGSSFSLSVGGPIRLEDISKCREMRERERVERDHPDREQVEQNGTDRARERHFSTYKSFDHMERLDDDWRHVEAMLNCIIGMVEKTKRAMLVLHERSSRDRDELSLWSRRQTGSIDADVKKCTRDMMAYTLQQTEERVNEVRRRAEDVVNDVRRQAVLELQKAVSAADQKAADLLTVERVRMEREIMEIRKKAHKDVLHSLSIQEESAESCWNCGRKASETCSGCNVARYCGSFCQHKDWESHHHVCGKTNITSITEGRGLRKSSVMVATSSATLAAAPAISFVATVKDSTRTSTKENVSVGQLSPAPSIIPSLSTKDNASTKTEAESLHSSSLASPKAKSPSSPLSDNPAEDSQCIVGVSSENQ